MSDSAPRIFSPEYYARMGALESWAWRTAAMRDTAERLLAQVHLPQSGTALDVGCGTGQTMSWLRARYPAWTFTGFDVSTDGLQFAAHRGEQVQRASALAIPYADHTIDLVITLDVLQHLPHPDGDLTALAEIRRVLRPGGIMFLRTNGQSFPRTDDDPEAMFRKYETAELDRKLRQTGFLPLRLSRINALLGLAEIPRELRARRDSGNSGYHGLLAAPRKPNAGDAIKRWWLGMEGRAVAAGMAMPMGRTIITLCRAV